MSIAAAQASKFYEQVVTDRVVFTFESEEGMLIFPVRGMDVIPFWSSRTQLEKVVLAHPKFRQYDTVESSLAEFVEKILPQLQEEKIHVGVNWSGARLSGYDVSVEDLLANLQYWLDKAKTRVE